MADAKTVSPLLDDFSLGSPFSSHNGIICCPAIHAVTKEKFILKQVSVPESQTQVNAMLLTGACADQTAAQSYYEDVTHGLEEEIRLLERLAQTRGFAPFYSHQATPKANGEVGMDLWVLSPYRTTLSAYARRNAMTHLNAVNLGIDLCAALTLSRKAGYLYQNLKPDNIFVTSQRQFQLGDFGFLPLEDLPYATFPAKYRGPFAAPELFDDFGEMNATIDLYALGMVLYLVYNGGQGPFAESQEGAEARRLKGEALPPPAYADYEMAAIILKAAAFRPEDRWQSPEAMGQALVSYMQRNPVNDSVIAAPIVTAPTLDAEAAALDARAEAAQPEPEPEPSVEAPGSEPEPQPAPPPSRSPSRSPWSRQMRRLPQKSRKLQRRQCRRSRLPKKRRRMKPCPRRRIRTPKQRLRLQIRSLRRFSPGPRCSWIRLPGKLLPLHRPYRPSRSRHRPQRSRCHLPRKHRKRQLSRRRKPGSPLLAGP